MQSMQPMEPEQAAETLYIATRNMQQGADFHDQMRSAFASLMSYIKEKKAPPEPKEAPTNGEV